MKKPVLISLGVSLLLIASCGTHKTITEIEFDANTNQTLLCDERHNAERNRFQNGRKVEIMIKGIDPESDSIVVNCEQVDVFVGGDEPSDILSAYGKEQTASEKAIMDAIRKGNATIDKEKANFLAGEGLNDADSLALEKMLFQRTALLDKILFWNVEIQLFHSADKLDSLLELMRSELQRFEKAVSEYDTTCKGCPDTIWVSPVEFLHELIVAVKERKLALNNQTRYYQFIPSKEQVDLEIKVYKKGSNVLKSTSGELTFSTVGRFKMTTGIGGHLLLIDGKYARTYENIDSVIVSGNGSNIRPSLGTYLNGTWNQGWGLMGFGLGVGLPLNISGDADLTPNFSVFMTCQFQTDYGRMGFNIGMGICKTNELKAGYSTGQNIGSASMDVPLTDVWRPGLMFGLNYVIGKQGKQGAE